MKQFLFSILLISCLPAEAQVNAWLPLNSGTNTHLRDVFFTSRDTGYVVGDDSLVLRTYDGGNTWTTLPALPGNAPGDLQAVWMLNASSGFVAPRFLYNLPYTNTSGTSWTFPAAPGNPCYPDGLFFDSVNEGFIYGRGCFGGAYLSRWNGSSWGIDQQIFYGVTPGSGLIGMKGMAKDPVNNIYMAVGDYGKIFRSTDAFQTWDTIAYADTTNFTAIDYAGNNTFYASSSEIINSVFISTDGGQTFAYDQTFMATFYYSGFEDIDMLTNGYGVAVGFSQTTGGGFIQWRHSTGWGFGYQPVNEILHAVHVVDSTRAFAVGDSGAIYRLGAPSGMHDVRHDSYSLLAVNPNPAVLTGEFKIDMPAQENWSLEIFSVEGKFLYREENLRGTQSIPVAGFTSSPGIYFLHVKSGDIERKARVVVR